MGVRPLEVLKLLGCKIGLQKICKIFASELGFKFGIMRGFQKGITLGGRNSESVIFGFAKKFAKILHLRCNLSQGSWEVSKKVWHFVVGPLGVLI